jgi:hypothetical protein
MKKSALGIVAAIVAVTCAPQPAAAQFGALRGMVPGQGGGGVNPDTFVAQAAESTRYLMVGFALLAAAASESGDLASARTYVTAVQGCSSLKELAVYRPDFEKNGAALNANKDDTAAIQARYDRLDEAHKQLMSAATYNVSLGILHNVILATQVPGLISSIQANPMQLMKVGQLKMAAEFVVMEAKMVGPMISKIRDLRAAMKVEEPADAKTTKARVVDMTTIA